MLVNLSASIASALEVELDEKDPLDDLIGKAARFVRDVSSYIETTEAALPLVEELAKNVLTDEQSSRLSAEAKKLLSSAKTLDYFRIAAELDRARRLVADLRQTVANLRDGRITDRCPTGTRQSAPCCGRLPGGGLRSRIDR